MEKICVAVRVRPHGSQESSIGSFWKVGDNRISLHKLHGTPVSTLSYAFDHVFDESCSNSEVYELLTRDIIHAAVDGFNGTAFAYGQTSSGKTFTMKGSDGDPGIIHRAVKDVFDKTKKIADREFLIRVSYMEIYNEDINDLLAVRNQKLTIHESLERGIFVAGLREEIVNNADQVLELLEFGEANRHFGETNMNMRSSRSHTVFRMVIESKGKDVDTCSNQSSTDAIRVSVLNLVDLAGSERIAKTGAGGVRLKEGKHINKSLMALGNVINKLSEGPRQRGHIPYRDSKLTRILQPALGGNAKTSIICTVAPEEIHIEETKGTLQFASRAKRITNCAQVNEVLTDAALLKRQKIEIEELRKKLQGSHAGVLEQEILKLRNEMLKYELEKEKLEMELEEERKSQKEREQCIREQWMKDISNLATCSDCDKSSGQQRKGSTREILKEECSQNGDLDDNFSTPCLKAASNTFVVKRSNYSEMPVFSPLPDSFSNVADEDTWFKMNKGYTVDLDAIQMTPARKVQSFPPNDLSPDRPLENHKLQIENLKQQLELVTKEKNEFQRKHTEQVFLNNQLTKEMSKLKQQALLMQEMPERFSFFVASCKRVYEDALSTIQESASESPFSSMLLLGIREIGFGLLTTLETQFSTVMNVDKCPGHSETQEPYKALEAKLMSMITSLIPPEARSTDSEQLKYQESSSNIKGHTLSGETTCERDKLSSELNNVKVKYHGLEKEIDTNNKFLETCKERYSCLEREFQQLKAERDLLLKSASESSQNLAHIDHQKETVLKELSTEVQRRKVLEEEIKQFSAAFASRQKSLVSFHNEFRSKIEKLRDENQNPILVPKSLGC